ncbi:MAG: hypothetical protein ACRC8S_21605 [Fimbriiglobus sp.]
MNPFHDEEELADGMTSQSAPMFLGALILVIRSRVGVQYVTLGQLFGELFLCGTFASIVILVGSDMEDGHAVWLSGAAYLLVILFGFGYGVWTQGRAQIHDLRGYSPVHRSFSGIPRLYGFPPNRWLERLIALEPSRPKTARFLARLVIPLFRIRRWLSQQRPWFLKAIAEPFALGGLSVCLLFGSWLLCLPFWLVGMHGLLAAVILCFDQAERSFTIYQEVRELEDAGIAANRLAERLRRRRNGGW